MYIKNQDIISRSPGITSTLGQFHYDPTPTLTSLGSETQKPKGENQLSNHISLVVIVHFHNLKKNQHTLPSLSNLRDNNLWAIIQFVEYIGPGNTVCFSQSQHYPTSTFTSLGSEIHKSANQINSWKTEALHSLSLSFI